MFKFNLKGINKRKYPTQDEYLKAVYEKNKGSIKTIAGYTADFRDFKRLFDAKKQDMDYDRKLNHKKEATTREVLKKMQTTRMFTTKEELFAQNFISGLKEQGEYGTLRNALKDKKGRFISLNPSYLERYDGETYVYRDPMMAYALLINFDNYGVEILRE